MILPPDDLSLEQLRNRAKEIRDLARSGNASVLELVATHHPGAAHPLSLASAQLVVARHYGFGSWTALSQHVELVRNYSREPDAIEETTHVTVTDRFLALACLRYGDDDGPVRWERALRLLTQNPEIVRTSIYAAAAAADAGAVASLLDADPSLAERDGGPYRWEPILYLAYARHAQTIGEEATLETARLLLEHGADANAGYLWHGLTTPFTALTGALGSPSGEQPQHPAGMALARLLLEHGADANDGQALYNRQFGEDDSHLVLLLDYGLGQGDGGPWHARLGHTTDSPYQLLRGQLWWAIVHDMRERVQLLVDRGADFLTPYEAPGGRPLALRTSDGRSPAEVAALAGCPNLVDWLVSRGATRPRPDGVEGFIAAALSGDLETLERLRVHLDEALAERPALVVWAAARRLQPAVRQLVELGFDVNALGRSDVPMEQAWHTALHHAAGHNDLAMAKLLMQLGADPKIRDARFHATPLGWAEHFSHPQMIELLAPVTSRPAPPLGVSRSAGSGRST